ncbi:hypothetical protein IMSAGC012_02087 [Lachnospiraceae bacterium]|nr:hypothetical protein IMSAGC012_02087 [Lachnospiraceae bacterium]
MLKTVTFYNEHPRSAEEGLQNAGVLRVRK